MASPASVFSATLKAALSPAKAGASLTSLTLMATP
jgi:hypothetical protein